MEGEEGLGGQRGAWASESDGSYGTKEVCGGRPQWQCLCVYVCMCLCFLFPAGYFKHSFVVGYYHTAVRPLCWIVRGRLLSLESSALPGVDRYMSELKL